MQPASIASARVVPGVAAAVALAAACLGTIGAATADLALFDAPRGAWVGTLRSDAPLHVLEERDGWRRVRIEAWIPAAGGPGSESGGVTDAGVPEGAAPAARPAGAPAPAAAAMVRGTLLPVHGLAATPGAGLPVLLVGDLEDLDREHARAADQCRDGLTRQKQEIASLQRERERILKTVANFREAVSRGDRLKERIGAAEADLRDRERDCRARAEEIFDRHAVGRTVADAAARFEFGTIPPGRYRVVALDGRSDPPRAWSMDCSLAAGETRVVDPLADRSPIDPYWRNPAAS